MSSREGLRCILAASAFEVDSLMATRMVAKRMVVHRAVHDELVQELFEVGACRTGTKLSAYGQKPVLQRWRICRPQARGH